MYYSIYLLRFYLLDYCLEFKKERGERRESKCLHQNSLLSLFCSIFKKRREYKIYANNHTNHTTIN